MTAAEKRPRTKPWRDVDTKAMGERVRALRLARGVSQRELAFPGCSYAYLSRIEAGTRTASGHMLDELARRLGTTRRYLETGEETLTVDLPLDLARLAVESDRRALELINGDDVPDWQDVDVATAMAARLRRDVLDAAWSAVADAVVALEEGGGGATPRA